MSFVNEREGSFIDCQCGMENNNDLGSEYEYILGSSEQAETEISSEAGNDYRNNGTDTKVSGGFIQ